MTDSHSGPEIMPDGRVCFRLWAPSCDAVSLEIEGRSPLEMHPSGDGWFEVTASDAADARYLFRVRDDLAVPDPASRFQPDGVHGPSAVIDTARLAHPHAPWSGRPWHEAVIYELHVGALDGYEGVIARLNRLANLGITAIELMPLATFGGTRNWGYDGVLPYAPHPDYGTPAQLRTLIDAAHARRMMVLIDVVYNHFGPDGNYLAEYADDFFDDAQNSPWGRGIAFANPNVAAFFHDNALMWLFDYGFDGLRIDAAWAIREARWFADLKTKIEARRMPGQHVHLILENENNDSDLLRSGYDAQWNDDFHNTMHVLLTDEHEGYYAQYTEHPIAHLATIMREGFFYQGQIPPGTEKPRGHYSGDLPSSAFVVFLQNHDQIGNRAFGERLIDLAHPDALIAAYGALLLSPFIPMLFMGEDWGSHTPFLFFTDYHGELGRMVLEGRRKEFAQFASFQDPSLRHKIADPNARETFERSIPDEKAQDSSEGWTWLALTKHLLDLRRTHITPHIPTAHSTGATILGPKALRYGWELGPDRLEIMLNLGAEPVKIERPTRGTILFSTSDPRAWPHAWREEGQTRLPGYSLSVAKRPKS